MNGRVVVTGVGLVTPLKPFGTIMDFWDALCAGTDAVRMQSSPMLDLGREWLAAGIDAGPDLRPEEKFIYLCDFAIRMAVADSNIEARRAGLSVGTVLGNILSKQRRLTDEKSTLRTKLESLSYAASHFSSDLGLEGPQMTISTACASGTDAIGAAARKIVSGEAEVMIAGGADVLSDFALAGFQSLQALTPTKVRPFDKNRSGLALGEGAAFAVLESEGHARQRGARVYGRVLGYASRLDAHHLTAPHREGRGLAEAAVQAIAQAGPVKMDYINAHGTGTIYNDLMETVVIRKIFEDEAYRIPVSSTKSMLGHSFGAAGAIETICCLLSILHKQIPPTINYEEPDPQCDLDYVPNRARSHDVRVAMSLSAGFGGQNSAIIVGEAQ